MPSVVAPLQPGSPARAITVVQLIAQLQEEVQRARLSAAIGSLQAKGVLLNVTPHPSVADFHPVQVEGVSLSEIIVRERR